MAFARRVEELSRLVESLQIRAAAAIDGEWGAPGVDRDSRTSERRIVGRTKGAEFRNPAECLRGVLRIGISEARRRLALARSVVPGRTMEGEPLSPLRPGLAEAMAHGEVSSQTATVIALALESVHHVAGAEAQNDMETSLVDASRSFDQDAVRILSCRWVEGLHPDGDEPSEEELARRQGAFVRKAVRGLHHLEIFATTEQFEHLVTVMNASTNPRSGSGAEGASADARDAAVTSEDSGDASVGPAAFEDRRSRAQKLLEGLVGACRVALASGGLPRNGGLRPQVMVTIPFDRLFDHLSAARPEVVAQWSGAEPDEKSTVPFDTASLESAAAGADWKTLFPHGAPEPGSFVFTGPVNARTIRRLACDAELIPVVLGGEGEVLDIGRVSRVFPSGGAESSGRQGPGLRVPRLHHARTVVRSPPRRVLVPRRPDERGQWGAPVQSSPPRDPQRRLVDPRDPRRAVVRSAGVSRSGKDSAAESLWAGCRTVEVCRMNPWQGSVKQRARSPPCPRNLQETGIYPVDTPRYIVETPASSRGHRGSVAC